MNQQHMDNVLIIGCGIAGLSSAIALAEKGIHATLISPFPSERAQSVMAAGGINAVDERSEDSIDQHVEDTLKGGHYIAGEQAVRGLCAAAPGIIEELERLGTVFTRDKNGHIERRPFGGQTYDRTCYCGTSTGKQIVTALVRQARRYEAAGLITRQVWTDFHSALIRDGQCYGALLYNEATLQLEPFYADAVIMATGGQNALFGKTTGTTTCDGYAAGRLLMQGVELKNLEFIQYHPTTIETAQKRMLVSEAARGEGGRLYYEEDGKRVYFMEDLYGPKGNLMPRDVVSRCMYDTHRQVWLDVTFLGKEKIDARIPEVRDLCMKYRGIDITREPIPVEPSVHFFMGGIAVDLHHETNIRGLFAVGECASIYHGANRLGGNSLLAAVYGGQQAAETIADRVKALSPGSGVGAATAQTDGCTSRMSAQENAENTNATHSAAACSEQEIQAYFENFVQEQRDRLARQMGSESRFPVMYIRDMLAENMKEQLGIVRKAGTLEAGIADIDFYLSIADKIHYDSSVLAYFTYSLPGILTLAKAVLMSALARKESRGAHYRSDYPERDEAYRAASVISMQDGELTVRYDTEGRYEQ